MFRSILAAVVGFAVWTVLWLGSNSLLTILTPESFDEDGSTDSATIFLILLILSVLFSIVAGYLTARFANTSTIGPVLGLGIALLATGLFVQFQFHRGCKEQLLFHENWMFFRQVLNFFECAFLLFQIRLLFGRVVQYY